jgi:acyl-CoA synthetase (AMP-forming)/AMP-acid ligase II
MSEIVNVGLRLSQAAADNPNGIAIAEPHGRDAAGRIRYRTVTFRELDDDSNRLAEGLIRLGARPGMRLVLMVPQSIDFIALVFAMFKAGVVTVLIDPGMGRSNILNCLAETEPEGFIAIPLVHALRVLLRRRFPKAKLNITAGQRWFWGGTTLKQLRSSPISNQQSPISNQQSPISNQQSPISNTLAADPAAIIFTTGSTGPPKGVLYCHGNFDRQVTEIRDFYGIQPGEIDVSGFPLFALFNAGMGVTTVIPQMDPTRPASVDPRNIVDAVNQLHATQAFGSPALWNVVGKYCEQTGAKMPTLKRVLSAGAPVPPHVLSRMRAAIASDGDMHTPYGATESLPVASISVSEVLGFVGRSHASSGRRTASSYDERGTAAQTAQGAGTCVGRHFPGIQWRVVRITDDPIPTIDQAESLPSGEIGELIVQGPVVTREYVTRLNANALHKIADGESFWHRMGDVGYLDSSDRFWFCGRKSHRVQTASGTLFTEPCEAIFNQHPAIYRSALVGVGPPGQQTPAIIAEPWPEQWPKSQADEEALLDQLCELSKLHEHTQAIDRFFLMKSLPVDIRHNAKIFREKLAIWAAKQQ